MNFRNTLRKQGQGNNGFNISICFVLYLGFVFFFKTNLNGVNS